MKPNFILPALVFSFLIIVSSCGHYVTPGSSVNISELADEDIAKLLSNKPATSFPANIAIARIQHPTYTNYRDRHPRQNENFSLILTRDDSEDEAFQKLSELEGVNQASPFNRLLLPYNYKSIKDLRLAAAKMKASLLMVYTFDTEFSVGTKNFGPQNALAFGYLNNKEVRVATTASVALFDVQTEYLYGIAESTAIENKKSNAWKKNEEIDKLRLDTERKAFTKLMEEVRTMWSGVFKEYGTR